MLSRFSNIKSPSISKCVVPVFTQRITTVHTSTPLNEEVISRKEFPPATSKRDFKNYPSLIMRKERPPVRLGIIPYSWFQMFYPKTGVTGPYVFLATVGTYLFSKEKIIVDTHFSEALCMILLFTFVTVKFGDKIRPIFQKLVDDGSKHFDDVQNTKKNEILEDLAILEKNEVVKDVINEATVAKKNFVLMQMELAFRERILQTHKSIKSRLDCLAELESAERRNTHKNLADYVLRNVNKGLTPELEKNVMQNCIAELNALAAKA